MPLFDYYCKDCEKCYEVLVPLSKTKSKIKCPKCKKELKKIISPVYFSVKG